MRNAEEFRTGLTLKAKFLVWLVIFILAMMAITYCYVINHEQTVLSQEVQLRGETICNNLATGAEELLVMKDDLGLAKLIYDTKVKNQGVVYCFVVDDQNIIWAHTDITLVNTVYKPPVGSRKISIQDNKRSVFEITVPLTVAQTKIGEAHIALSKEAITAAVTQARKGISLVTVAILLLGIASILILVSFIIGSLSIITSDIEAIGNGDLDRKILTTRRDEIGRIAYAVKAMAVKLKKANQELIEKERMKREMQIAKEIQQALLPRAKPNVPGFLVDSYYQAATEVGGDYYDFIEIDSQHSGIVIADVAGKGVGGSMIMTMLRSLMRAEAQKNVSPRDTLSALNLILSRDIPEGMFITLFYIVADFNTNEISYCCAGHNPAYLFIPGDDRLIVLKPEGLPLGIGLFEKKDFETRLKEEKRIVQPGDTVLLYTDGVTEAMNTNHEQFGVKRLETLIRQNGRLSPDKFQAVLKSEIQLFTGAAPQSDDITFVILQKK